MQVYGKYFYGNEVSEYGQQNGYVDYCTLAKAFNAVMANDLMTTTQEIGYWEPCGSSEEYFEDTDGKQYTYEEAQERIEELNTEIDELSERITADSTEEEDAATSAEIDERRADIEALEDAKYYDVFQWFIVDGNGADILQEAGEIVYYNDVLDLYLWGVTHYGTSWDYVLTNIRCNTSDGEEE